MARPNGLCHEKKILIRVKLKILIKKVKNKKIPAASHRVDTHAHAGLMRGLQYNHGPKYVRHLSCTLNTSDLRTAFACADWYAAEHSPADGWFVASVVGWLRICLQLISVDLTRRRT